MHYKISCVWKFVYFECIKPFKFKIFFMLFSGIYWAFDINFVPQILKFIINSLNVSNKENILINLLPYIFIYVLCVLLKISIFRIYGFVVLHYQPALKTRISQKLMNNLIDRSQVFLQKNVSGSLSNQIQDIINVLPEFIEVSINHFPAHFLAFIVSVFVFWSVNIKFAFLLSVWTALFLFVSIYFSFKAQKLSSKAAKKQFIAFGELVDILYNIFSVKIFNTKKHESANIHSNFSTFAKASIKKDYCYFTMALLQSLLFVLYQGICLFLLIYYFQKGIVSAGDFVLIFSINRDIMECMWAVGSDFAKISNYYGSIKQVLNSTITNYLEEKPSEEEKVNKIFSAKNYDISFENISFKYPDEEKYIFKNFSLNIKNKEKLGIVGYSGAGKSTLINLLLRLCKQEFGKVKIDGLDIKNYDVNSLREEFSVITQDLSLFNRSIMENIKYGKMNATNEEAIAASKKAHAHEFILNFSKKYEMLAGQKGSNLSMGQRQRILIARAILRDAPIFILDEATSSVDKITEAKIQVSLNEIMKEKTVIVIAHRIDTLQKMDRIIVLNNGKIVQEGNHEFLKNQDGLYKELINSSSSGII